MTNEEKLQQLEFACESILEILPKEDSCKDCPFSSKGGQCESKYQVFQDYCAKGIIQLLLRETKERQVPYFY